MPLYPGDSVRGVQEGGEHGRMGWAVRAALMSLVHGRADSGSSRQWRGVGGWQRGTSLAAVPATETKKSMAGALWARVRCGSRPWAAL